MSITLGKTGILGEITSECLPTVTFPPVAYRINRVAARKIALKNEIYTIGMRGEVTKFPITEEMITSIEPVVVVVQLWGTHFDWRTVSLEYRLAWGINLGSFQVYVDEVTGEFIQDTGEYLIN